MFHSCGSASLPVPGILCGHRTTSQVEFIKREMSSSDIICLQEFWFDPAYETIFRSALGDSYDFHTVKRTGGKSDGVAVLLRKGKWDVRSKLGLSLSAIGDRVALVMHLRSKDSEEGKAPGGEDLILVNTHLAFPHNSLDRMNQMAQIEVITETVETVVREAGLPTMTPRVVVGDLNVEGTDPVCGHLGANGFRSAFASLHLEQRVITHRNHKGEEVRGFCGSSEQFLGFKSCGMLCGGVVTMPIYILSSCHMCFCRSSCRLPSYLYIKAFLRSRTACKTHQSNTKYSVPFRHLALTTRCRWLCPFSSKLSVPGE